jgi:hypothetical protein
MFSADEFHGCGIDDELYEFLILLIPPSQRSHQTVGLHASCHALNQLCQPC